MKNNITRLATFRTVRCAGIYMKTDVSIETVSHKSDCRLFLCASARKDAVCSFRTSLNSAGLTSVPPSTHTYTLHTPQLPPNVSQHARDFLLLVQTGVFHFTAVSKSIPNTKAGVLMAVRKKPLINEGTRAVWGDLFCSRAHTCAPRGLPWSFLSGQNFFFWRGGGVAAYVLLGSFSHALL